MSEFSSLMATGFVESLPQIGCDVTIAAATIRGILTPGPLTFAMEDVGYEVSVDQSVEVITSDLATIGLSLATLPASCTARQAITVDGTDCILVAFNGESADPTTKLYLKIAR